MTSTGTGLWAKLAFVLAFETAVTASATPAKTPLLPPKVRKEGKCLLLTAPMNRTLPSPALPRGPCVKRTREVSNRAYSPTNHGSNPVSEKRIPSIPNPIPVDAAAIGPAVDRAVTDAAAVVAAVVGRVGVIAGVVRSPPVESPNAGRPVVVKPGVPVVPRHPGVVRPAKGPADGPDAGVREAPAVAANAKAPGPEAAPRLRPLGRQGHPQRRRNCQRDDLPRHSWSPFNRWFTWCHAPRTALLEPLHLDSLRVGQGLAVHRPVRRLPAQRVLVQARHDVGGGHLFPVAQRGRALDEPFVAVPRPDPLPEAVAGLERPGADVPGTRIPADPLRALADGDPFDRGRERREDEVAVAGPGEQGLHRLALLVLLVRVGPAADQPLQLAQPLGVSGRDERRLAHAGHAPGAALLDVNDGVAGPLRDAAVGGKHVG